MNANYPVDLHGHTNRSDGNDTPLEYIESAIKRGLKVVAITDHDVVPPENVEVDGKQEEIVKYAKTKGLRLIKGIEISCETEIEDVHLVCFGCEWKAVFFKELDVFTVKTKKDSYFLLISKLKANGINISWDEVLENNGNCVLEDNVQKKMIFELMARKGYVQSWKDAKLMVNNTTEYNVKRKKPKAVEVINKVHELGGVVILAHPYLIKNEVMYHNKKMSKEEFIEELIQAGLDGIEA